MPNSRDTKGCMFMPFNALNGYQEMISKEKRQQESRHELSEEDKERLSHILFHLPIGKKIKIKYWDYDRYEILEGTIQEINPTYQIVIIQNISICFEDIYRIKI